MEVFKLSGGGNDFIAVVEPAQPPSSDEIRTWCQRGLSLGADGFMLLERAPDGARMTYFNSDGERSTLCLNGCRCAARLAFELGWGSDELVLATDAGKLSASNRGTETVEVSLPAIVGTPEQVAIDSSEPHPQRLEGWFIEVGVPHFVLLWPHLDSAPVATLGRRLRSHPAMGNAGANVNFVERVDRHTFQIRTYERGVEAETLACGTGVVAAAQVLGTKLIELPVTAICASGARLVVSRDSLSNRFRLSGDARIVARCELLSGAVPSFDRPRRNLEPGY